MGKLTSIIFTSELLRKQYCPVCGKKLKREKVSKILEKGDEGFTKYREGFYYPLVNQNVRSSYIFTCQHCEIAFADGDEVRMVRELQKRRRSKILSEFVEDRENAYQIVRQEVPKEEALSARLNRISILPLVGSIFLLLYLLCGTIKQRINQEKVRSIVLRFFLYLIISFLVSIGFKAFLNHVWESGFVAEISNYIFVLLFSGSILNISFFVYVNRKWSEIKAISTIPTLSENDFFRTVYMIGKHWIIVHRIVEIIFLQLFLMLILVRLKIG